MNEQDVEMLISAATELGSLIAAKNLELIGKVTPFDLDDPELHDFQTCQELAQLAIKLSKEIEMAKIDSESNEAESSPELTNSEREWADNIINKEWPVK